MITLCNFHTHTKYCDGTLSPEEMTLAAIARGDGALGFSGHGIAPFDPKFSMTEEGAREYVAEIARLRNKYASSIDLFIGIEQDYFSSPPPEGLDYIIGSAHYIKAPDGTHVAIDAGAKGQKQVADTYFGGDYYALAEAYFGVIADVPENTNADFIAHFDLVSKYNLSGVLFDEAHPRYRDAAIDAMERILRSCRVFEVNTGAIFRLGKPAPYPSFFLLRELLARGGEVILSSDSHDAESLCFAFPEMAELLQVIGYKYVKQLTKNGFAEVALA